ncbi:TonB-dependent receptor [Granulicella sp. dw_53]|uniref:TonB-dependent receptor n=1 Tax=Granulicella sp. dw_53 TaxID=2719792 RepID=UPI001BD25D05|nr:TonB-dependent receptor [Granulicella sp. dw_53]
MRSNLQSVVLSLVIALSAQQLALSQAPGSAATVGTGEIRIHVKDPSGHPVQAQGTLFGPTAGRSRNVEIAPDGSANVPDLPFGRYQLRVTQSGFSPQTINFQVQSSTPLKREILLSLPGVSTTVTVIASNPIGTLDVPISDVPVPVQTLTSQTIEDTNAIDLTDVLKKRLNGVYVNENQNNPFQPDVNYRGYTASPLVGSPAGLSVYLDGVRQNQPFGDVVAWDLIPKVAITSTELIPGSNPVYGLNTLGGAIAVQTKNGLSNTGFSITGYGGSFGRRAVDAEYGGSNSAGLNWYAAGTLFHEDGWRVQSPSGVRQSFAKLGYNRETTMLSLSGGYAINDLTGNGTQDFRAIARTTGLNHGYDSVYSIPDRTMQHSPFLTFNATHAINSSITVNGNAYLRYIRTNTTNGDINDDSFDQSLYTLSNADKAALTAAGIPFPATITPANTPFPFLRCIAQGLELSEPGEKCTGVDTDTVDRQHAYGLTGVISWRTAHNQLAVGAGWDHGSLTFQQSAQYGYLNPDGITVTRIPVFLDGSTNVDDVPQDNRVNLHGSTNTPSFFLSDTLSVGKWVLTAAGRYNHTNINNLDRLPPVSYRGTLTAINTFQRFNPSAGVVYKASDRLHAYFDYSESSRAPTSTELGCADPNFPCSLPNALVSDPPLKQVVSRTYEAGLRGNQDGAIRWSAGFFHTNNYDDLLFVASQQTGYGFFQNFGKTRRLGVEANLSAHLHNLDAGAEYTFLNATYQSSQTLGSGSNSSNSNATSGGKGITDGGNITISPGNRIPQVPQHLMKLYADYHPLKRLSVDADLNLIGASYVRGNENNQHQPDGVYYLGPGQSPGYGVANLGARYKINAHYELFAQINNLLNRHYYTAGQLASTPYDNSGAFTPRPFASITFDGDTAFPIRNSTFFAPGAPITVFGGLKVSFGRR